MVQNVFEGIKSHPSARWLRLC